eukprot:superscaffoldBa00004194_g18438
MKKLHPFLVKHCKQGGVLPGHEQLMEVVLQKIHGKKFLVVVDETTDARDCSVLNIIIVLPNIFSLLETEEKVQALTIKLTFISEGCAKLMTALIILEGTHCPTAVSAHNVMEDLEAYLVNGTAKTCGCAAITDELLRKMGIQERREVLDHLHDAFHLALTKFSMHWGTSQRGLQAGKGV